jgi:ribosomal-protein-serine acetyltransferase
MTEAVALLTDFAFTRLGATRIMMRIDERNHRSLAVAERVGFVREGCLRNSEQAAEGRLRNMVIMARLRGDRSDEQDLAQ